MRSRAIWTAVLGNAIALACTDHASLVRVDPLPPGAECPAGGVVVLAGPDDDGDGQLDATEVESSQPVCDGADGATSLVRLVDEPAGAHCAYGGTQIQTGVDDDRDGELEPAEVDGVAYACDARASLVVAATVPPGAECSAGGTRLDSGVDADGDGSLDPSEIASTVFVCSGQDAQQVAVRTTPLAPGVTCPGGGTNLEWGVDDDRDGVLDDSEVDQAREICDGETGATSLVLVTPEPAGPHCSAGGSRVDSGVDADGDGALAPGEVDASAYVCNGGTSAVASYRLRLAESPVVAMREFGGSVATDGYTLAVSTRVPVGGVVAVFVYERPDAVTPWHLATTLTLPAVGNAGDRVVVDGDVLAVTAYNDATEGSGHGAVFVYERIGGTWTFATKLLSGAPFALGFGMAAAVRAGTIVVSAGGDTGRLFTFRRDGTGTWQRTQTLVPPGTAPVWITSLAMSDDALVVGGGTGSGATSRGAAWVYQWVPASGTWLYGQELLPRTCCVPTPPTTAYGSSVAIDGHRVVVSDPGGGAFGRALVFDLVPGTGWEEQGALTPADANATLRVGGAVAVSGEVVALTMLDDELGDPAFSTRLFTLDPLGGWLERQRLLSPDRRFDDSFGGVMAASGATLVVCAPSYGTSAAPYHGVCHDYRLAP